MTFDQRWKLSALVVVAMLASCGGDPRSYEEHMANRKRACEELGLKWVKDGNHWTCWGLK